MLKFTFDKSHGSGIKSDTPVIVITGFGEVPQGRCLGIVIHSLPDFQGNTEE